MTLAQRVQNILTGLLMLLISVLLFTGGEDGYPLVLLILTVTLLVAGLRELLQYGPAYGRREGDSLPRAHNLRCRHLLSDTL